MTTDRVIILAAGEGTRLRPYTDTRPKCLVELAGQALLGRQLAALASAGLTDVTVVTGHLGDQIVDMGLSVRRNERYGSTNMVASLMCAADLFDGETAIVIAYGDIVYEPRVLEALRADDRPISVAVDRRWLDLWSVRMDDPLSDAETLRLAGDGRITELGRPPGSLDEIEGQYIGLIRVAAGEAADLVAFYNRLDPDGSYDGRSRDQMYMTSFIQRLIDSGTAVGAAMIDGGWLEVDTTDDLDVYHALAAEGRLDTLCVLPGQ